MNKFNEIKQLLDEFNRLGIAEQIDYKKFYLYSIITNSTAIEGSTVTELENQLLFDKGIAVKGRSITEQMMNLDLKTAYEQSLKLVEENPDYSVEMLKTLAAFVMKNTGAQYNTPLGSFDSSKGDIRLLNVSAGFGGKSYLTYNKVPEHLKKFCSWLNAERKRLKPNEIFAAYTLSFIAHLRLVTIHPWADGNGRTSRLVMNLLQWEFKLLPTMISKEHKDEYINALILSREQDDENVFVDFMFKELTSFLIQNINDYKQSAATEPKTDMVINDTVNDTVKLIYEQIKQEPSLTYEAYSKKVGLSRVTVARSIKTLVEKGCIVRVGSDKSGNWKIVQALP